MQSLGMALGLCVLSACRQSVSPENSEKVEGPPIKGLSHDQLAAALVECTKFGRSDDARVRYTPMYCSTVMSAHLSEGYTNASKSKADPEVNRLH